MKVSVRIQGRTWRNVGREVGGLCEGSCLVRGVLLWCLYASSWYSKLVGDDVDDDGSSCRYCLRDAVVVALFQKGRSRGILMECECSRVLEEKSVFQVGVQ